MKMLSPGFPMRRSSGLVRYGLLAIIILIALYSFTRSSTDFTSPKFSHDRPVPGTVPQDAPPKHNVPVVDTNTNTNKPAPGSSSEDKKLLETQPKVETPADEKPPAHKEDTHEEDAPKKTPPPAPPADHSSAPSSFSGPHPIDKLIYDAQLTFAELASKETKSIDEAAQAYRKRRGRHPLLASTSVYHDLEPFWGIEPSVLRKESWDYEMTINIRDGNATAGSDFFWTKIWLNMVKSVEHLLPDMDISLNAMDEPRLVVPWEDIAGYMGKAARTVKMAEPKDVISKFQKLPAPGKGDLEVPTRAKNFEDTKPYWAIARRGCAPDSASQKIGLLEPEDKRPTINSTYAEPHMYKGFVNNFTLSSDVCHQPDLQTLEGIFIQPLSTSATKVMFPMFGGSKLSVNNEILLPAPMYWNEEERFTGGDDHGAPWAEKENKAVWRGVATGGLNTEHNWRGFQRHRFVAMNNGTKVTRIEGGQETPENFALAEDFYNLQAQKDGKLGEWIDSWSNISFTDLSCSPPQDGKCNYTGHYFKPTHGMKMAEQFSSKYLPDIDGNSFSGRYLGFLRSTSLPIKATIWREWHDSRLVPWKHFVPMDSRFVDYYNIMEYFLGYQGKNARDRAAEKIASEGKEWAEQVLRKEDMSIYVLRLLLEYARLLDDKRENMGWVEDVVKNPSLADIWKSWW
ncbi:Beta-1,2-xylosyltransferase 1-like protein [Cladobotryum mycophilum]|uniref:Beta-1,2-xylosyltransferase 1-like protein n=1 Tax=Cladobotryum mycophilum TaxID=491253 RepID=A0ABR0STE6_9HYPO